MREEISVHRLLVALAVMAAGLVAVPAGAQSSRTVYYFAEGSTRAGIEETLYLFNSGPTPVDVTLEYDYADGSPPDFETVRVGARSNLAKLLLFDGVVPPERDVSIVASADLPFSAARGMRILKSFDSTGEISGGTLMAGITTPNTVWHLAEGSTLPGFQEYITIQNPGDVEADLTVAYGFEGTQGPVTTLKVPPHSRRTIDVNSPAEAGPGQVGVSARVTSRNGVPVLVERPFYFHRAIAGSGEANDGAHVAAGTLPANEQFFAEGTLLPGWHQFLTLYNPDTAAPATVEVDYLLEGASPERRTYELAPNVRRTVQVYTNAGDQGIGREATAAASKGVSMSGRAGGAGVVAERPLYAIASIAGSPEVNDGTNAVGATVALRCADFATAQASTRFRSFVTIANIKPVGDVNARVITYEQGAQAAFVDVTVPPGERRTVDLRPLLSSGGGAVKVEGMTDSDTFVAEEPVYADFGPGLTMQAGVLQATPSC